ncbi:bacterial Ig-like domain-containing protein, partial [Enterococcus entomosocium]
MSSMFQYGSSFNTKGLKEINLSSFDTSKVTNMSYMFLNAGGLTGLDLSSFNTSNVANMRGMFDFTTRDFKKLKLGSNFKFLSDAALNDISFSPTVKWQNVGTGTNEQPNGNFIMSSSELMSDYDGSTMADTYVWQPAIQTAVKVHDSTLYIGTEWKAEDNFDSAIDKDGNPVDFADVTVEGTVDTSKTGTYEVSYSYEGVTSVATITVKAIQTAVNVHDSTLYIGTEWKAEDNFDSAIDKDGNPVDFADVTVEGTVDTSKTG